jgi:hypothetical protein
LGILAGMYQLADRPGPFPTEEEGPSGIHRWGNRPHDASRSVGSLTVHGHSGTASGPGTSGRRPPAARRGQAAASPWQRRYLQSPAQRARSLAQHRPRAPLRVLNFRRAGRPLLPVAASACRGATVHGGACVLSLPGWRRRQHGAPGPLRWQLPRPGRRRGRGSAVQRPGLKVGRRTTRRRLAPHGPRVLAAPSPSLRGSSVQAVRQLEDAAAACRFSDLVQ